MADTKITINGQQYDSPDAMPPDVRHTYEEAMRSLGPMLASGGKTQVFSGHAGPFGGSIVVNRVVTVNDQTYRSTDELPPDVHKQYEAAMSGVTPQSTHPKTTLNLSLKIAGREKRTLDDAGTLVLLPIEPSTLESRIRAIPWTLAFYVVVGLVLWALLGR